MHLIAFLFSMIFYFFFFSNENSVCGDTRHRLFRCCVQMNRHVINYNFCFCCCFLFFFFFSNFATLIHEFKCFITNILLFYFVYLRLISRCPLNCFQSFLKHQNQNTIFTNQKQRRFKDHKRIFEEKK